MNGFECGSNMNFFVLCLGHAAFGRWACDANIEREERAAFQFQVWLSRTGHHGIGYGQKPPKLGP